MLEIGKIKRLVELREQQILSLQSADHAERRKALAGYEKGIDGEAGGILADYAPLHDEILAARAAYMQLAAKALDFHERLRLAELERHSLLQTGGMMTPRYYGVGAMTDYEIFAAQIRAEAQELGIIQKPERMTFP